jgi:hypothetical protein
MHIDLQHKKAVTARIWKGEPSMNPYGGINSPCSERADHLSCTIVTNNLSRLPCESKIAIFESLPNLLF